MAWTVEVLQGAGRDLRKLPTRVRTALLSRLASLREDPRPENAKKLSGAGDLWRIRDGDYRLIYRIRDDKLLVLVVRAGHRREVYRHVSDLLKSLPD